MKSIEQRLAEKFDELEENGQRADVIEIRESRQSWEAKLAAAEKALGVDQRTSERRLAEAARCAFDLTPEQAEVFAGNRPIDPFWGVIKEMN